MTLFRQCCVLLFLGFLTDLLATLHIQACAARQMLLSVATIVLIYLVGFLGHQWFVEHKGVWARLWLTVAGAAGAGCGTAIVLFLGE